MWSTLVVQNSKSSHVSEIVFCHFFRMTYITNVLNRFTFKILHHKICIIFMYISNTVRVYSNKIYCWLHFCLTKFSSSANLYQFFSLTLLILPGTMQNYLNNNFFSLQGQAYFRSHFCVKPIETQKWVFGSMWNIMFLKQIPFP